MIIVSLLFFVFNFYCGCMGSMPAEQNVIPIPDEGLFTFCEIANAYNQECEEHDVTTEDGYILKLFHLKGNGTKQCFLNHGIFDSGYTFILRGNESLSLTLARAGWDVWIGNQRGTTPSRRHITLDPDSDKEFWDFSLHELATRDLPAIIDYILEKSNQEKVTVFGHSQGNQVFYVLGSEKPEYNDKIQLLVALGAVAFGNDLAPVNRALITTWGLTSTVPYSNVLEEFMKNTTQTDFIRRNVCTLETIGYILCCKGFVFAITGADPEEIDPPFFMRAVNYFPMPTSFKNLVHLGQIGLRNEFAQFDYGPIRNLIEYGSTSPKKYDLSKVTMPVALMTGKNDNWVPKSNTERLASGLGNVVENKLMEREEFSHVNFVWAKNMDDEVYPTINALLEKYT